jgi:hypothetical protein
MHNSRCALTVLLLGLALQPAIAEKFASIIIDDIGNNFERGEEVIYFPADVTLSILPRTIFAERLATLAHKNNKEVMLHLPLQSVENRAETPGTLSLHMTYQQFSQQLKLDIDSVPFVKGINNHMGSLLTQHPGYMDWLMGEIAKNGPEYFFIDSRTTEKSVAAEIATEYDIPNLSRDVFLDPDDNKSTLQNQFDRFIEIANQRGYAIAIAHPHPRTLEFIKRRLADLEQHDISIVPVSILIAKQGSKQHVTCTGATCAGM